jgi:lipoprotein-releasing system ATP-binding protein
MSKVQSPKSQSEDFEAAESLKKAEAAIQREEADVGHWTLDIGLTVSDLRKSFPSPSGERIEVLRGVSFSAVPGETVAVMGVSGAGKSTLLHLLGGIEEADHGSIAAGQFSIDDASRSELARFRNNEVGFIFQFHHLLPDLTAAENVSLPLMINRTSHREAMHCAVRLLQVSGLGDRISHLIGHLSGGEQQRVAVCRALVTQPALVFADEPTGNLDTAISDQIAHSLVSYARETPAIVVLATHNQAVAAICDRILILRDGRLFTADRA